MSSMTAVFASLAVIVPTKNRPLDLEITIEGVLSQTILPKQMIVIDQSETDESERRVRARMEAATIEIRGHIDLIYTRDPSITGGAAARNRALSNVSSDFVLFLDDDVILEDRFIQEILAVYNENPRTDGVSGIVTNYITPPAIFRCWARIFTLGPFWDDRQPVYWRANHLRDNAAVRVSRFTGCLMSFRKEAIEALLFDENLHGVCDGEDVDFCARLKSGAALLIAPKARLVHNRSPIGRSTEHWLSRHARTMWYLYQRNWNRGVPNRLCFLWLNVGYVFAASFVSIRRLSPFCWKGLVRAIHDSRELATATLDRLGKIDTG